MHVSSFISVIVIALASANVAEKWSALISKCIYVSDKGDSFDGSQQSCVNRNGSLLIMKSQDEKDSTNKFLTPGTAYRVGYRETNNGWQWLDKSTYFPSNWWRPGDPSPGDVTANYIYHQNNWVFDGHTSTVFLNYICEKSRWRKLSDDEKYKMCGVEFMSNCDGRSCDQICLHHPGCSSFAILSNTCVNMKNSSNAGENCSIPVSIFRCDKDGSWTKICAFVCKIIWDAKTNAN